ncbi:hypothetical protein DV736_g1134, partial [Chaetothyriales sp. CBS 134916]
MSTTTITLPNGVKYEQPVGLFINNEFRHATGDEFDSVDPSTGKTVLSVKGACASDVDAAVDAARKAYEGPWSGLTPVERGDFLRQLSSLIDRDRKLIAAIDAYDCGKPYSVALEADLDESYNVFKYYAGWADKIYGDTIDTSPAKLAYTVQEPLGVCGQIIPWNFPFMMLAWKVAPALACGNVVIVKPAEQTPLSAMYFGKLVQEAGLPAGVVNIVPGLGGVAGKALAEHLKVDKIAFTGSTNTGRSIMRAAATNLKNITLECGGKNPLIVFEDANLEQAVKWAHAGIMDNSGQVCTSTSRIYVQEKVYDDFVKAFVGFTKKSTAIGSPFKEHVNHGPQVSKNQFDHILSYIEAGRREGAKILCGGVKVEGEGYYIEPTIFVEASESASISREEIFGPVVVLTKFATEAEVVAKANDTSYGLAAALFTEKISRGHRVARKLHAGMVWINSSGDSHFGIPFGGYKSSGIGRELGRYALDAYTQTKAIHATASTPCLSSGEAYNIALRWLQIFQTDAKGVGTGSAIIPSTLAKNFTVGLPAYYDEGASFGDPSPVYKSSDDVLQSVTGSGYSGALVTNVTYSIVEAFSSCDTAVLRWQSDSLSAKATNVTVPVGTSISYRGTDYLRVDLETRLIYNATSSSDLLNYYIQLKDNVIKARV